MKNRKIALFATPLLLTGLLGAAPNAMAESATFSQPATDTPTLGETLAADLETYEQSHHRVQVRKNLPGNGDGAATSAAVDLTQLRTDLAAYYDHNVQNSVDNSVSNQTPRFVQDLSRDLDQFERTNGDLSGL